MAGILMIKSWRDRINNVATNLAQINSEWEKKRLIGENEIETLKKSQGELQQFLEETEIFAGGVSVPKPVISELDAENVDTKKELEILKEEVKTLRAQIQQLLEENDELRRELKDLKESVKSLQASDNELVLGELCWHIQSMIYRKVLPPSEYSETMGYKLFGIEENLEHLLDKDEDLEAAKQAWAKLKRELNFNQRDFKALTWAMKESQTQRNTTAHPELTEQMLNQSVEQMKNEGKLKGMFYKQSLKMINLWKKLTDLEKAEQT